MRSYWLLVSLTYHLIGRCYYFGFGSKTYALNDWELLDFLPYVSSHLPYSFTSNFIEAF